MFFIFPFAFSIFFPHFLNVFHLSSFLIYSFWVDFSSFFHSSIFLHFFIFRFSSIFHFHFYLFLFFFFLFLLVFLFLFSGAQNLTFFLAPTASRFLTGFLSLKSFWLSRLAGGSNPFEAFFPVFSPFSCFSFICSFSQYVCSFPEKCVFFFSNFSFLAFVSRFSNRCFLRSRCSTETWCPDDNGRDSWDWVGPPAWERARFNSPEWGGSSSPVENGASPDWIIVVVPVV